MGGSNPKGLGFLIRLYKKKIRATDAKEVGVENPAEETCCYPNQIFLRIEDCFF